MVAVSSLIYHCAVVVVAVHSNRLRMRSDHNNGVTTTPIYVATAQRSQRFIIRCGLCAVATLDRRCGNGPLEEESLIHIFCKCDISACIWEEVINWYNTFGYNINYLSDIQIILGDKKIDPILNRIILTTKTLIFKNKKIKE